ncbi:NTF2-related export protein [Drosophila virilis]|uniref:NTF2-related export protein n=2 Tax=virilis group TaxID=32335 RepID=B4M7K2_DROVI|nr:NTF2-related export protein [Drosophila virilis]EDW62769.2 uncharacterized protein Dvir_GJ17006 [Drosophila virilis]
MNGMNRDLRAKIEACNRTAEEFTRLYYASLDNRRHQMGRLYIESAKLTWNGNGALGREPIEKQFLDLPPSRHQLTTLDSQPILDPAVGDQITYMVLGSGTVKYAEHPTCIFQQSFVITAENDKWKIASDCYRLQEPII